MKQYKSNKGLFDDSEVDAVIAVVNNSQHHDLLIWSARVYKQGICKKTHGQGGV